GGRGAGLDGRDLRGRPAPHRLLAVGRRALLHPGGQVSRDHHHRGAGHALPAAAQQAVPGRDQLLPLPPEPGRDDRRRGAREAARGGDGQRADRAPRGPPSGRGGDGRLRAADRRRDGGRRDALRAGGRRRSGLGDRPADPRLADAGARVRVRQLGSAGGRRAHGRGRWMAHPGGRLMPARSPIVFLLDVDNTLLDNDRVAGDLKRYLTREVGAERQERYWAIFEALRTELGYADYLGALQRYRVEHPRDPHLLAVSSFLVNYPFANRLYPESLDVLEHVAAWGPTV